ncbi:MAG TPA: hypothetical protein VFH73_03050 [Polyangia bacterium]|nr:hypothetical protein [Polyangia bacterium]
MVGLVLLGGAVLGCASEMAEAPAAASAGAGPAKLALDPRKRLTELTPAERATLCDWTATKVGGYGTRYYCEGSVHQTYATQAACLVSQSRVARGCTATVADSQACTAMAQEDPCGATARDGVPTCAGRLKDCFTPSAAARPK